MVKTVKDACEELGANAVDCVLPRISTVLRRCAEYVADSGAELGCRVGTAWSVVIVLVTLPSVVPQAVALTVEEHVFLQSLQQVLKAVPPSANGWAYATAGAIDCAMWPPFLGLCALCVVTDERC